MKRVFGFALFFVALGMVIMMFIPSIFIGILIRSAVPPCRISAFLLLILKKYENLQGKP